MTVYDLMTIMDKLSSLRAFVKVVELGSFSEAGRQLRLSRSAISKYVSDLEQDLGVQLLNRTTRHASPTKTARTARLSLRWIRDRSVGAHVLRFSAS